MDDRTSGALLLAVGGIALRLGLTDAALAYVKPGLKIPLVVAGLILVGLGAVQVVQAFRRVAPVEPEADLAIWDEHHSDQDAHHDDGHGHGHDTAHGEGDDAMRGHGDDAGHGHSHAGGPRVAWLLTLPLLALLLIAPPPLGAFAAGRQADAPTSAAATFPALPGEKNGAVELTVSDYVYRALYDKQKSLDGKRVRLSGFVTAAKAQDDAAFRLTRFQLSCCAADGQAINIAVKTDEAAPPVEQWLQIEGTWVPREGHKVGQLTMLPPLLEASSITPIEAPKQPYEY